jgi:hypothetical protein
MRGPDIFRPCSPVQGLTAPASLPRGAPGCSPSPRGRAIPVRRRRATNASGPPSGKRERPATGPLAAGHARSARRGRRRAERGEAWRELQRRPEARWRRPRRVGAGGDADHRRVPFRALVWGRGRAGRTVPSRAVGRRRWPAASRALLSTPAAHTGRSRAVAGRYRSVQDPIEASLPPARPEELVLGCPRPSRHMRRGRPEAPEAARRGKRRVPRRRAWRECAGEIGVGRGAAVPDADARLRRRGGRTARGSRSGRWPPSARRARRFRRRRAPPRRGRRPS